MPNEEQKIEADEKIAKLKKLPDKIIEFLLDPETTNKQALLYEEFKLNEESRSQVRAMLLSTIFHDISLEKCPNEIIKASGLREEEGKKLAIELLGLLMLPISDYLGDVENVIQKLGGDPSKFANIKRITLRSLTVDQVIDEVLKERPVTLSEHLQKRLRDILESRVREVRKDEEVILRLTRPEKIGGVAFDAATSQELLEILLKKMRNVKIITKAPLPVVTPPSPPAPTPPALKVPIPRRKAVVKKAVVPTAAAEIKAVIPPLSEVVTGEEEREAARIRETVLPKIAKPTPVLGEEIAKAVKEIITASGVMVMSEFQKRLETVIEMRLRDIRDSIETHDILTRKISEGGLGLDESNAQKILFETEKHFVKFQKQLKSIEESLKKNWLVTEKKKQLLRAEERQKKEEEELEKLFTRITKRTEEQVKRRKNDLVSVVTSPKEDIETKASPAIEAPDTVEERPKIADVKYKPKLIGPIEELRAMTVMDFRRLSSDPVEAALKIEDKIESLKEETMARYLEGIRAFRESEVYRLYLEIMQESFTILKPIPEIIKQRQVTGKQFLTEKEIDAIIDLSKKLRF